MPFISQNGIEFVSYPRLRLPVDEEAVFVDLEEAAWLKVESVLFLYISGIEIIYG